MKIFNAIIVGAGPAAISCGLVLGSAAKKEYMKDKKIGMISYSKASDLFPAVLNNLFGIKAGSKGGEILGQELEHIKSFDSIEQLEQEAIEAVIKEDGYYEIKTENNSYKAKNVVLAIGHSTKIGKIKGLENHAIEHKNSLPGVKKIALKNTNLLIEEGLYAAGLTSGCASQAAIAIGTGADVAVQLLTKWNNGIFDHHHDK